MLSQWVCLRRELYCYGCQYRWRRYRHCEGGERQWDILFDHVREGVSSRQCLSEYLQHRVFQSHVLNEISGHHSFMVKYRYFDKSIQSYTENSVRAHGILLPNTRLTETYASSNKTRPEIIDLK